MPERFDRYTLQRVDDVVYIVDPAGVAVAKCLEAPLVEGRGGGWLPAQRTVFLLAALNDGLLSMQYDVACFHEKFGVHMQENPGFPPEEVYALRLTIEREEFSELEAAHAERDLPGIVEAVCDLIYVLLGRLVAMGVRVQPIWDAVHETNMEKVGGSVRSDGKILKPLGWRPPDVARLLREQGWELSDG